MHVHENFIKKKTFSILRLAIKAGYVTYPCLNMLSMALHFICHYEGFEYRQSIYIFEVLRLITRKTLCSYHHLFLDDLFRGNGWSQ